MKRSTMDGCKWVRATLATIAVVGMAAGATACSAEDGTISTDDAVGAGLEIHFPVAYSAFDGTHTFKVPATVTGVKGVKWSASDPSMVDLEPNSNGTDVMITTKKAGAVDIIAKSGGLSGSARLTITQFPAQMWEDGNDRYNNGIVWERKKDGKRGGQAKTIACTTCHGKTDGNGDIEHTPTQTAGYTDADLITIFTQGKKPPGVEQRIMPFDRWNKLHQWQMTDNERNGLVVYLRALTPKAQGVVDFGMGHGGGGKGGWRDGGASK
jgi:hypothetical protein